MTPKYANEIVQIPVYRNLALRAVSSDPKRILLTVGPAFIGISLPNLQQTRWVGSTKSIFFTNFWHHKIFHHGGHFESTTLSQDPSVNARALPFIQQHHVQLVLRSCVVRSNYFLLES